MARQRINPSVKIAIGIIAAVIIYKGGYAAFLKYRLSAPMPEIQPDHISMIAVRPGAGYKIIVANRVAKLCQVPSSFGSTTEADSGKEDAAATNPKFVPIKEMLDALQGSEKGLTKVITRMNQLEGDDQLPSTQVLWTLADVRKALAGDATLKAKLENDLNVHVDGTPLDHISLDAIENGIVIQIPVPVKVKVAGTEKTITGTVRQWLQPAFCKAIEKRYSDSVNVTEEKLKGIYLDEVEKLKTRRPQDVKSSVEGLCSDSIIRSWAEGPEHLLEKTQVLVNSSHLTGASYEKDRKEGSDVTYTLRLNLTAEGRDRLWKFSAEKPGFQLLLVVDGIAIAAPRISTELSQQEVMISNMLDSDLLDTAVEAVTASAKK